MLQGFLGQRRVTLPRIVVRGYCLIGGVLLLTMNDELRCRGRYGRWR